MASRTALFLAVVLLLSALVSGCNVPGAGCHKPTGAPSIEVVNKCPMNTLKLGVCANVLGGLINIGLGHPPKEPCCGLIHGLVDLEAAACVCIALKADILGIHLNLPISLNLLLNYCGKHTPQGFQCV